MKNEAMGRRIRELRGHRTLEEFAQLIGVSAPAVQRYESGRIPRSDILVKIAELGKQSVEWFLRRDEDRGRPAVWESPVPYFQLRPDDRKLLKEVEALIQEGDAEITAHLRRQVALLRRLKKSQTK